MSRNLKIRGNIYDHLSLIITMGVNMMSPSKICSKFLLKKILTEVGFDLIYGKLVGHPNVSY